MTIKKNFIIAAKESTQSLSAFQNHSIPDFTGMTLFYVNGALPDNLLGYTNNGRN